MRLLCLHGYGTNGECLRGQMMPTMNALDGEHECVFIDGEISVGTSAYTGNFDPPYLAYYEDVSSAGPARAHEQIDEAIEVDGPFDGIVGFSQGAGLAISYLLQRLITNPNEPSPFKFGIFFSTSFIIAPDQSYKEEEVMGFLDKLDDDDIQNLHGIILNPRVRQQDLDNAPFIHKLDQSQRAIFREVVWDGCCGSQTRDFLDITDKVDYMEKMKDHQLPREMFPRFFNTVYTHERISIPTVHCRGRHDTNGHARLSTMGSDFCSGGKAFVVEHSGKHDLPVSREEAKAVADAIEKAFYIGQQQAIVL